MTISAKVSDAVGNTSAVTTKTVPKSSSRAHPRSRPFTYGTNTFTASWAAPTATGGSAIDGYQMTYTPSGGSPVSVTTSASVLTATVSGLPEGTPYSVTVGGAHRSRLRGLGGSPDGDDEVQHLGHRGTSPTKTLAAGGTLTVTGKVYRTSSPTTLIAGARMAVYQVNSSTGAKMLIANNVTTKSDGTYSYSYAPPNGSWKYQATWVGDTVNGFASSAPSPVVVVS